MLNASHAASTTPAASTPKKVDEIAEHRMQGAKLLQRLAHELQDGQQFTGRALELRFKALHVIAGEIFEMVDEIAAHKAELAEVERLVDDELTPRVERIIAIAMAQQARLLELESNNKFPDVPALEINDELAAFATHDLSEDPFEGIELIIDVDHGMTPEAASDLALDTALDRSVQ